MLGYFTQTSQEQKAVPLPLEIPSFSPIKVNTSLHDPINNIYQILILTKPYYLLKKNIKEKYEFSLHRIQAIVKK